MASRISKVTLHVLNSTFVILGLALCATSLWFFVQVNELTSLRNSNHYLLDYRVYWPQAIPWMFIVAGMFILFVSCCGFSGVKKSSKGMLFLYTLFLSIAVVVLILVSVIALVFADNKATDDFVKDTVWDAYFQAKSDTDVAAAFGSIEKKLQCCGAESPRDYKNWKTEFPISCCDVFYHGWGPSSQIIDCDFTNKLANERHGCSQVASQYARIAIKVLSAVSLFVAFLGIVTLIVAIKVSRSIKRKPAVVSAQDEIESKKILY